MTQCKQPWWVENEERDKQKRKAKDDEIDRLKRRVEELEETIENGFDHIAHSKRDGKDTEYDAM